jgi:hypothetical protein
VHIRCCSELRRLHDSCHRQPYFRPINSHLSPLPDSVHSNDVYKVTSCMRSGSSAVSMANFTGLNRLLRTNTLVVCGSRHVMMGDIRLRTFLQCKTRL